MKPTVYITNIRLWNIFFFKLSWNTNLKSADVSLAYSIKVSPQKDMRHPTTNWHSLNSANYLEFVMVLPMASLTRISHVTLHTHVLLIWILWPVTELWRDPSHWDSLKFSICIPTSLWVIPVLSDCTMSLAASRTWPQHISLPPLSNQASSSLLGVCEGNSATHSFDDDLWIYSPQIKYKYLLPRYVIWIDIVPFANQKCQHLK